MRNQRGFTLVEMVVIIAIVALCGFAIVELFIASNRLYKSETAELNITNDARAAVDDVDNYVRQAYRTLSSYSSYSGGAQTLILQIQSVNATDQLIPATYDHVVYYLDSGKLYRQVFPNGASTRVAEIKRLANNVNGLTFSYNSGNFTLVTEVTTDITIQEDAGLQNRAITISSKSKLRNY